MGNGSLQGTLEPAAGLEYGYEDLTWKFSPTVSSQERSKERERWR
jgi:hypothetical protein